jgi:hypothetical protein
LRPGARGEARLSLPLGLRVILRSRHLEEFTTTMRILIAPFTILTLIAATGTATAETKIFIIENQRDGYGVDQCLASGANCGKPVASAYCQSRQYNQAVSFRKVDREEITGGGGVGTNCHGGLCTQYVAIECSR